MSSDKTITIKQPTTLSRDLSSLLNKATNYDIAFNVASERIKEKPKKFYAHKLILASRRDFVKDKKEINIKEYSQTTFNVFLTWIYTGSCVIKQEYMMELIEMADKFQLDPLKDAACDYVIKGISQDTVYELITDVRSGKYNFNSKVLLDKCVGFMEDNDMNIINSKSFLKFDEELVNKILQSDKISVDEVDLFKAVLSWGKQNKKPNQSVEAAVSNLIQAIRFPLMTPDQLMDVVKPSAVVPDELYLKGLEYNIVGDGPFDKSDKAYRPRGFEKRIIFTINPSIRLNFNTTNGQQTIEKIKGGNSWDTGIAFCDKPLSKGKTYWEVTIHHLNSDRSGLRIGITALKEGLTYANDITIGMSGIRHNCYNSESQTGVRCGQGDRIGVLINWQSMQVKFFRNGHYINTYATLYSGSTYYPVVHMFYVKDKVTIDMKDDPPKGH